MHIPDGFLDPKVTTGLLGAAAAVLAYSFAKVRALVTVLKPAEVYATAGKATGHIVGRMKRVLTSDGESLLYKMGMAASLVFAAQMFNFPIGNGTSGHLIGGVLSAVILGPFAGTIVISIVLTVQSFFFADGGIFALGANIINMGLVGTILAYYIYYIIKKFSPEWIAIVIAAWSSVVLASFACALELGFSGTISYDAVIPAMLKVHMLIGIAEALITLAFINIFRQMSQEKSA